MVSVNLKQIYADEEYLGYSNSLIACTGYFCTNDLIDPAPGAWFTAKFISLDRLSLALYSGTEQKCGLKHHSFFSTSDLPLSFSSKQNNNVKTTMLYISVRASFMSHHHNSPPPRPPTRQLYNLYNLCVRLTCYYLSRDNMKI